MGVLGLTTFVREHEKTLGKTTKRDLDSSPESIVVDGWSFVVVQKKVQTTYT